MPTSERAAFAFLTILQLLPVWIAEYPASCDGPAHLETAHALRDRLRGVESIHSEYLAVRRDPTASWFPALSLAVLLTFAPPVAALKLFISGYVLLFPLAVRFALRSNGPGPPALAYAAFPLVYNRLLLYGFFGFLYGLTAFLFVVGWWRRQPHDARYAWRLTALALAVQAAHVFALGAALLTLVALGIGEVATAAGHRARAFGERVLTPLHAFLPALVLAAAFLLPRVDVSQASPTGLGLPTVQTLAGSVPLTSYRDQGERALAGLFVVVLASIALRQARRAAIAPTAADAFLLAAAAWALLWTFAPTTMARGSFLKERCALCLIVTLVLWAGGRTPRRPAIVAAAFSVIAIGLLAIHAARFIQASRDVDTYTACASTAAPGSTLLPIGPLAKNHGLPFLEHAASYVAIRRGGINLGNYQPATDHFPLALRERRRPAAPDASLVPQTVMGLGGVQRSFFAAAVEGGPRAPDYLLVSGTDDALTHSLLESVKNHYRIEASCSTEQVALLRRRSF